MYWGRWLTQHIHALHQNIWSINVIYTHWIGQGASAIYEPIEFGESQVALLVIFLCINTVYFILIDKVWMSLVILRPSFLQTNQAHPAQPLYHFGQLL